MVPVREDESGFRAFCIHSHIGWIKLLFMFVFAHQRRAQDEVLLFPRRQELPRGSFYEGMPPEERRRFALSHGWACERHPTPSAQRIQRLAQVLEAAGADDDDAVFLDYASLFGTVLGLPPQRNQTAKESKCFRTALFEMSRMFAFGGVKVNCPTSARTLAGLPSLAAFFSKRASVRVQRGQEARLRALCPEGSDQRRALP